MKKIIGIGIALISFSCSQAAEDIFPENHSPLYQWIGYIAECMGCTAVHVLGNYIQEDTDCVVGLGIFFIQVYLAKALQNYISKELFELNANDWAAAENNWAQFWGWLLSGYISKLTHSSSLNRRDVQQLHKILMKLEEIVKERKISVHIS